MNSIDTQFFTVFRRALWGLLGWSSIRPVDDLLWKSIKRPLFQVLDTGLKLQISYQLGDDI